MYVSGGSDHHTCVIKRYTVLNGHSIEDGQTKIQRILKVSERCRISKQ